MDAAVADGASTGSKWPAPEISSKCEAGTNLLNSVLKKQFASVFKNGNYHK